MKQHYKNLSDLLEKCPNAFKYYTSLSYDVQEMLNDANPDICTEDEFVDYIYNNIGLD